MKPGKPRGIFCLEGPWDEDQDLADRTSVLPTLELLQRQDLIRFIHRDVATATEFRHYIDLWAESHLQDYDVAYFAFHGAPGLIQITEKDTVHLAELAAMLKDQCAGVVIHFGSCSVLECPTRDLQQFLNVTGARAVCGYKSDVDWVECAALDLLLLWNLAWYRQAGTAFNRFEGSSYRQFVKALEFIRYPPSNDRRSALSLGS